MRALAFLFFGALVSELTAHRTDHKPFYIGTDVISLTNETFSAFVETRPLVLVEFYAPWCPHCSRFKPEYISAAAKLKQLGIPTAALDCQMYNTFSKQFDVRGYPTFKIFRFGVPSHYYGLRSADGLLQELKYQLELPNMRQQTGWSDETLRTLDAEWRSSPIEEFLAWCAATFQRLVQVSSFGVSGMSSMHALYAQGLRVPVLFVDTLHHFPETLQFVQKMQLKYKLDLHIFRCQDAFTRDEFERFYGTTTLWFDDPPRYDYVAKVEPLVRGLRHLNATAWITGRRRDQGGERSELRLIEFDEHTGRIKINPLAYWTLDDVWEYSKKNSIPHNELYDRGYASIGDSVNTRPVNSSAPERSGRFWQQAGKKTECGIHKQL